MYWIEKGSPIYNIKYDIFDTTYKNRRKEKVCDNIMCFDIETSSGFYDVENNRLYSFSGNRKADFYKNLVKVSLCYVWQFSIDVNIYMGRTLEDFKEFLLELEYFCPYKKIVYVHNLSFEFQFLRNILEFDKVFARQKRKPLFFNFDNYVFRCSYMLTRMSLENWALQKKLPVKKLTGYLDYNIPRTPKTDLTSKQKQYCVNDLLVMYYGLLQYKEKYGCVLDIPLTQTGEMRKEVRKLMEPEIKYRKNCINLIPKTPEDYAKLIEVYWGGYVHANYVFTDRTIDNVFSKDFSSSYPAVCAYEKFPMTPFIRVRYNDKYLNDDRYSYIIKIRVKKVESVLQNSYLSLSNVKNVKKVKLDNGRILKADEFECSLTNIDYDIVRKAYKWESIEILDFKISRNGYLNKTFVIYILKLFKNKTSLKNVKDFEILYAKSKEFINALYGLMVTKDITDDIIFENNEWDVNLLTKILFDEKVARLARNQKKVFTAFQFGVWVTAYARRNLWESVFAFDEDILYMDTDSVKYIHNHDDFFTEYNNNVRRKQKECAKRLNISINMFRVPDHDGIIHSLGEFEDDGTYEKFRTLGAKKYIVQQNGKLKMTVSGVRKAAVSQIDNINDFTNKFEFDIEHANKLILHYNDNQPKIIWNKGYEDEFVSEYRYGICAQPTTYKLGMSFDYFMLTLNEMVKRTHLFEEIIDNE